MKAADRSARNVAKRERSSKAEAAWVPQLAHFMITVPQLHPCRLLQPGLPADTNPSSRCRFSSPSWQSRLGRVASQSFTPAATARRDRANPGFSGVFLLVLLLALDLVAALTLAAVWSQR